MSTTLRILSNADARRAEAVRSYVASVSANANTRRTAESALKSMAALFPDEGGDHLTLPWEAAADALLFDEICSMVRGAVGPSTAEKYLWALRGLLRHMARLGLVDYGILSATVEGAPRQAPSDPQQTRGLSTDELRAMLICCHHDPNLVRGARDRALLALLASTGARRSEIARVEAEDLNIARRTVDFMTKGGRHRQATLHAVAVEHLLAWARHHRVRRGPIFVPIAKDESLVPGQALSAQSVYSIVGKRRDEAGLDGRITPHSFRRWFVTSLLEADVDLFTVMRAVGHRRPSTTQTYDKRGDDVVRDAVTRLAIPSLIDLEDEGSDRVGPTLVTSSGTRDEPDAPST